MALTTNTLSREKLLSERTSVLREGGWRASLWVSQWQGQPVFVKDARGSNRPYRWLVGRWLIRNEARIYRRLVGTEVVPRYFGQLDDALVVEHLACTHLGKLPREKRTAELYDRIDSSIRTLHDRGVIHLDLRSRRNILITADGRPVLVDFGSSLYFGRGALSRKFAVPILGWIDRSAVHKFRARDLAESPGRRRTVGDMTRRVLWPWPRLWRALGINRRLKKKSVDVESQMSSKRTVMSSRG